MRRRFSPPSPLANEDPGAVRSARSRIFFWLSLLLSHSNVADVRHVQAAAARMRMLLTLLSWSFPLAMVWAMASDALTLEIPNSISVGLVASFLVLAALSGIDLQTTLIHLGAGLAVLVVGAGLFFARIIGGGDAKLMAATSVWTGFQMLPTFLLYMAIAGGFLAISMLIYRRLPLPARLAGNHRLGRLHNPDEGVPYGIAIGLGGLLVFTSLPMFTN